MRATLLGAALGAWAAGAAGAGTVTFEDGAGFLSDVENEGNNATGTWNEAGFQVGFDLDNTSVLDDPTQVGAAVLATLIDDCGGCSFAYNRSLTFSRPDGLAFDLDRAEVLGSDYQHYGFVFFSPFDEDGGIGVENEVGDTFDLVFPDIHLTGTRSDGSTVGASFESYGQAATWVGFETGTVVTNDGVLGGEELRSLSFTDLVSLSVATGRGDLGTDEVLQRSLEVADIDPVFDLIPDDCLGSCTVEGLGQFFIQDFDAGYRGITVDFGDFTFAVGDAPAPVPLPAGAWLMGGALAGLGLARGRSPRR